MATFKQGDRVQTSWGTGVVFYDGLADRDRYQVLLDGKPMPLDFIASDLSPAPAVSGQ